MSSVFARFAALATLVGALLAPAAALAAAPASGTVVGAVTCGADEATPAAFVAVSVSGTSLGTWTTGSGKYALDVPANQTLTIIATSDPQRTAMVTRSNVSVGAGQTLDVGSMDLSICGTAQPPAPVQDNYGENQQGGQTPN